jgi:Protein of unknown function (DUF2281)
MNISFIALDNCMEQALLEQIQRLPESVQTPSLARENAFGIWKGDVWMSDDFNTPLDDLQEYM